MCTVTICFLIFHAQLITQFFSNFQQLINQCDVNMVNAMYNGMGGIIQNKLAANKNVPQTQTENRNPIDVGNDLSETSNECIDNDFFDDNDSSDSELLQTDNDIALQTQHDKATAAADNQDYQFVITVNANDELTQTDNDHVDADNDNALHIQNDDGTAANTIPDNEMQINAAASTNDWKKICSVTSHDVYKEYVKKHHFSTTSLLTRGKCKTRYMRCNLVKRDGPQCAAKISVRMPLDSAIWDVHSNQKEHTHDQINNKIQPAVLEKLRTTDWNELHRRKCGKLCPEKWAKMLRLLDRYIITTIKSM